MNYTAIYIEEAVQILCQLNHSKVDRMLDILLEVRQLGGRIFFVGVGGGAGHASHAVNDFRKIAGIECYAPTDNVSELTARINDDGWETSYRNWLRGSRLRQQDAVFVFSVGGGDAERKISANLVCALQYAKQVGAKICGIVGRDGGFTKGVADIDLLVPGTLTARIQEAHKLLMHVLCEMVEEKLPKK